MECRDNSKIVEYSIEWRVKLAEYLYKTFPSYTHEYINYCLDHSAGKTPSLLAVNPEGKVVGCHLYYCTKAMLLGDEIETQWGHDTYLDEGYRKELGVDFLMARKRIPAFGVGLTETNTKIRKLLKSTFINGVYMYITITPSVIRSPFQKYLRIKPKTIDNINNVKVRDELYKKVSSVEEINIPNKGYWYLGYYDLDFIRDKEFLDNRFFKCNVKDYKVFASIDSYFVVCESSYRGFPSITLCDFRYNPNKTNSVDMLLQAVYKVAMKSGYGILTFISGDKKIEKFFEKKICKKTHIDFISSYNTISPDISYSLSGGDSDMGF